MRNEKGREEKGGETAKRTEKGEGGEHVQSSARKADEEENLSVDSAADRGKQKEENDAEVIAGKEEAEKLSTSHDVRQGQAVLCCGCANIQTLQKRLVFFFIAPCENARSSLSVCMR